MKILFASWNSTDKNDYPYQNWYQPLKDLSNEIIVFDPREVYFKYGKENMNNLFIDLIRKEKPDYVFLTMIHDEFLLETFEKVKEVSPKTKLINFFSDDEWRFDNYSKYFSPLIDFCITSYEPTYKKARKLRLNNFYLMPFSCNTNIFKKLKEEKIYDIGFIGQPTPERARVLSKLIENGVKVNIWGKGWENTPEFQKIKGNYHGIAEDINKTTNQIKIMLNFIMDDRDEKIQIKGRITHVAGSGTFQIITDNTETKSMFLEDKEVAYFKNQEDLENEIKYYLSNEKEREEIAARAHKKILNEYTWDKMFNNFFKNIKNAKNPKINLSENYIRFSEKPISEQAKKMISIAAKSNPDVIITESSIKGKKMDLFGLRIQDAKTFMELSNLPKECFIWKNSIINKEPINGEKTKYEVIAYPLVETNRFKLRKIRNTNIKVSKKYEITLFNKLYKKSYLSLIGSSFNVVLKLAKDGNLFILRSAKRVKLPYKN